MQVVAIYAFTDSTAGNSYVLVTRDYFIKWMEAYAISNQEAMTMARTLTGEVSQNFFKICNIFHIKKTRAILGATTK